MQKITATVTRSNHTPPEDFAGATSWNVTLKRGEPGVDYDELRVPFYTGSAWTEPPTALDVLTCLASDACGYENARDFEEWASEYGYDTDSRRAERLYNQVGNQTEKLRDFLGDDFDAIVYSDNEQRAEWVEG